MTRIDPVTATEHELHGLFLAGLDGDAAAYHRFLQRLGGRVRGYFRRPLQQLPANQRLPIQHTKLEGLSVQETAQLTGMSESAVKVGVHRGLKALARQWKGLT